MSPAAQLSEEENIMGLTLPDVLDQEDLLLDALEAVMVGDAAYFSVGEIDVPAYLLLYQLQTNTYYLAYTILREDSEFTALGELAEKPGKVDSKVTKLKTRNYLIPGRRNSTIELVLNGISEKQKDYFESALFSGQLITIILVKNEILGHDIYNFEEYQFPTSIVIFSGMRWAAEWNAEADGLWTVVLSSEMAGATKDRIWTKTLPPYDLLVDGTPPWEEGA